MAYIRELIAQVVSSLLRNKLRSFLTMAGIAWGVASMVLIVAMGDGFKQGQRSNTKQLGENIVIIFGGRTEQQAGGQRAGRRIRLNFDDVKSIRQEAWLVDRAIAELQGNVKAVSPHNAGSYNTIGAEPAYALVRTTPIAQGRWLIDSEEAEAQRVCVIGASVRKQLFGDRTGVVGAQILVNGLPFRIVGFTAEKTQNSSYNGTDDEKIFVPYSTMVRDFPPKDPSFVPGIVSDIIYVPRSLDRWKETQDQVKRLIARNHGYDPSDKGAIHMWDTVENAQLVDNIFNSMTAFLATIAVVTLTLGGVGVMNIMLVTVTERTREIGLRKAVGATRRRILADFLVEGMLLASLSGVGGWAGAYGLASIVNSLDLKGYFSGLPVQGATTFYAFLGLGIVAVASAVWPAWRAATLTPVEALRYER